MRDIRLDITGSPKKDSQRQRHSPATQSPGLIPQVQAESANGGTGRRFHERTRQDSNDDRRRRDAAHSSARARPTGRHGPHLGRQPNDWLTYHQSYNGWSYSALDQINASNVKDLEVAWIHVPGHATRGLQSMPLAADGVLYYTGSYSRVFALDGATGKQLWSYTPELNDTLVARQTHSPYNRGAAIGDGKLYVGTVDGRLIALDNKTGKVAWDTKLQDTQTLTVGFTGAPLYAKGTVVIGSQGGEWPGQGPLYGVDAATGKVKWKFNTVGGDDVSKASYGNDSWRTGGGGGWMPGTFGNCRTTPGSFDSAIGEFVKIDRDDKHYIVHPNKSGFIFVYDRDLKVQNVWPLIYTYNFVKLIVIRKTVELIGLDATSLERPNPAIDGGVSWNSGSHSPKTGLYYKVGNEWRIALEVVKTTPVTEPVTQLSAIGHLDARDPITGAKKWEVRFPPASAIERAVHWRQSRVSAGRARRGARLQRGNGRRVVEPLGWARSCRRNHQLFRGWQAVRRRHCWLWQPSWRRVWDDVRRAFQEHAAR